MEERELCITDEESGKRLDMLISSRMGDELSRTQVKILMLKGNIKVNGEGAKPHQLSRSGDVVSISMPDPEPNDIEPENIPIEVVYEDGSLMVVNKPAGMVVHPAAGNKKGTLVSALIYHCGKLPAVDDVSRPGLVHRLDKDTSGVIVIAKDERSLRSLAKQFQKRAIKKRYVAIVKGSVEADNGIVDAPINRHGIDRKRMAVDFTEGKDALTVYHVVKRFKKFSLLSLEPETGRTHQIRVHMRHIGHPVIGDVKYGGGVGMARQALHAEYLRFTHPSSLEPMEFHVPVPDDMKEFLKEIEQREKEAEEKEGLGFYR